jgi:hypothetical protein
VVHNVVVRVPGIAPDHDRRPAALFVSHYDTRLDSLGAADGAPVAAMLETLRALTAGPPPQHDAVFLFADGDRVGALGTQAFVEQHPLARRIGVALRFDSAGNRGPLVLADASRAGGDAIAGWARAAPHPRGSSFMREVYGLRPDALRIGPLAKLDAPVLQFANMEGDTGIRDTPDRLDLRTLQDEGDTMLRLAREFTGSPLAHGAQAGEVYVALAPIGVFHYSSELVWPLTRLGCLLLFGVCCLAAQRAGVDSIRLVKGTFAFALFGLSLVFGTWLLWKDGPAFRRTEELMAATHSLRLLLGAASVAAALCIVMQRRLQSAIGMRAAALGALVCVAIALAGVSWAAPGTSCLLAWPMLAALGALAALHSRRVALLPRAARLAIVLAATAPALVLLVPALRESVAVQPPGLPLALVALLAGLCVMPLASLAPRFAARGLLLAGLACLVAAAQASPPPAAAPQPNPIVYYKDMPTWSAWWLAHAPTLDSATRQLFPDLPAPRRLVEVFGWDSDDVWYARAPRTAVAFPFSVMTRSDDMPMRRHVEFDLVSKNRAPDIELSIRGGKPLRATVNGRVLSDEEDFSLSISLYGMEDRPLHFGVDVLGDPIVRIHVEERIPGLPAHALPPAVAAAERQYLPMTAMTVAADDLWFR